MNKIDPSGKLSGLFIGLAIDARSVAGAGLALGAAYMAMQSTAYHNLTLAFLTSSSESIQNIGYAIAYNTSAAMDYFRDSYKNNAEGTFSLPPSGGGGNKWAKIALGILAALESTGILGECQDWQQLTEEEWEELQKELGNDEQYWESPP